MLSELATVLTKEPWKASPIKQQFLEVGYKEDQWLHSVMVVSYFNFVNRCVHATGIELEDDFHISCK